MQLNKNLEKTETYLLLDRTIGELAVSGQY